MNYMSIFIIHKTGCFPLSSVVSLWKSLAISTFRIEHFSFQKTTINKQSNKDFIEVPFLIWYCHIFMDGQLNLWLQFLQEKLIKKRFLENFRNLYFYVKLQWIKDKNLECFQSELVPFKRYWEGQICFKFLNLQLSCLCLKSKLEELRGHKV